MIELSNEFKMFLGRGMYKECSKIVIIKIREMMLSRINKKDKEYFSDNFGEIIKKYMNMFNGSKDILEELIYLEEEREEDDQVERVSKLLEIYNKIEES